MHPDRGHCFPHLLPHTYAVVFRVSVCVDVRAHACMRMDDTDITQGYGPDLQRGAHAVCVCVHVYTEGCSRNSCTPAQAHLPPFRRPAGERGALAAVPPFTFPCPLVPSAVLVRGPDPE